MYKDRQIDVDLNINMDMLANYVNKITIIK